MRIFFLALLLVHFPVTSAQGLPGDIDGDGLMDTVEDANGNGIVDEGETDPYDADTDGGGEGDGRELEVGHNPLDPTDDFTFDRDGDGLTNGEEEDIGTDPDIADTDGDGVNDGDDPFPLDANYSKDDDNDGLPDEYEQKYAPTSGGSSDNQENGNLYPEEDIDGDGLTNLSEFNHGTNPAIQDTDRDGIIDGTEIADGTDPGVSPCIVHSDAEATFTDTQDHWVEAIALRLHEIRVAPELLRVVRGYGDTIDREFRQNRNISRFEFVKIALLTTCVALDNDGVQPEKQFSDFSFHKLSYEHPDMPFKRRVLTTALRYNIIEGYGDGTLRADAPITRAEALKILLSSSGQELVQESDISFKDVHENRWFYPYVTTGVELGIIQGYPDDDTFRPIQSITRAEVSKIALMLMLNNPRVNGYTIPQDGLH